VKMHNKFTPIDLPVYINILASTLLASDNIQSFSFPCYCTLEEFFSSKFSSKSWKMTLEEIGGKKVTVPVDTDHWRFFVRYGIITRLREKKVGLTFLFVSSDRPRYFPATLRRDRISAARRIYVSGSQNIPNTFQLRVSIWKNSFLLGALQNCEKRILTSPCLPVCPSAWNNSAATGWIFIKFYIWILCEILSRKFKFR
jgi:hypothetical protein